jgi:hypothetical protein
MDTEFGGVSVQIKLCEKGSFPLLQRVTFFVSSFQRSKQSVFEVVNQAEAYAH